MKARVKETGEVFEIASYATIPMECCDSFGEPLCFCLDDVEILSEGNDLKESKNPDYWTRPEHQYAGMAMQGMVKTYEQMMRADIECKMDCCEHVDAEVANEVLRSHAEACAEFCVEFAHTLVKKLKKKEERK